MATLFDHSSIMEGVGDALHTLLWDGALVRAKNERAATTFEKVTEYDASCYICGTLVFNAVFKMRCPKCAGPMKFSPTTDRIVKERHVDAS